MISGGGRQTRFLEWSSHGRCGGDTWQVVSILRVNVVAELNAARRSNNRQQGTEFY
jgi:hypothetical protein